MSRLVDLLRDDETLGPVLAVYIARWLRAPGGADVSRARRSWRGWAVHIFIRRWQL